MKIGINAQLHDFHNFKMQSFMKKKTFKKSWRNQYCVSMCSSVLAIKVEEKGCFEKMFRQSQQPLLKTKEKKKTSQFVALNILLFPVQLFFLVKALFFYLRCCYDHIPHLSELKCKHLSIIEQSIINIIIFAQTIYYEKVIIHLPIILPCYLFFFIHKRVN